RVLPNRPKNGFIQDANLVVPSWVRSSATLIRPRHHAAKKGTKTLSGPFNAPPWHAQLLCRRKKRGTVERDRYCRRPHNIEQNAATSCAVEPLERAHEIGERSGHDANCLPRRQSGVEQGQTGLVDALDEGFHDTVRNGDRTILAGEQRGNADGAPHRQP